MEEGGCDDQEGNHLYLGIQMQDKKVNGCVENQLSVKLTCPYDLLTEDKTPQENDQPVRRKETVHGDDNHEADLSVCDEGKNQTSDTCCRRLGKETNESQNCQTSTDLTDPFSLSTAHGLLQKEFQQIETTLLHAGGKIKTGLSFSDTAEILPTLSSTSQCNMEVSGLKDSQSAGSGNPASSDPVCEEKDSLHVASSDPVCEQKDSKLAVSSDLVCEQKDSKLVDSNDPVSSDPVSEQKEHADSSDPASEWKDSWPMDSSIPISEQKNSQSADSSIPISEQKHSQPADSSIPISEEKDDQPTDSSDPSSRDPISELKDGQLADSSNPVSEQKDGQPPDSSDPVSSATNENLMQGEYNHNQTPLLETVLNVDNTLFSNDKVTESFSWRLHCNNETRTQNKSDSDSVSSSCNENLIQRECQFTQKTLFCKDGKIKTDLCKRDEVETPFPCRTISDKRSRDKKEKNQPLTSVDVPVDLIDPFGLSAGELSQLESGYVEHTAVNSGSDNLKVTLHTCGKLSLPGIYNGNKGGNENNELPNVKSCDPFNLSVEEDRLQNDYESVKMKLLELKNKFDNSDTDKQSSSLIPVKSNEKIKLTYDDKSTVKTDDPFDLSSEDDLYPEKYRPLKRKLCTDSKDCTENSNSRRERAKVDRAATAVDSQAVAIEAVLLKAPEVKKQRTAYRVAYVHSQQLLEKANELIRIQGRAELVHSLISSFGLLQYLQVVSPRFATDTEILGFHCPDYISFLRDSGDVNDGEDRHDSDAESYGLSYDCPLQKGIFETCSLISGATIVAAETLISNAADVAINWYGGWHHAKRDSAAGFCYINDIVLGILKLREKFDRILYVDIDLHHGDGVEEAFCMSPKVMTVSFHKYMFGFFPGTGSVTDIGTGKGKYYSVNVPLMDGIKDADFCAVFYSIMKLVREKFQPQAVVLQCGADTLSSDPMTSFNLTHLGISRCVGLILSWNLPTMLLGGGGYNFPNTAKCWSFLTSLAAGKKLPLDIPEHEHLLAYGPDFEMSTTAGNRKDCNTRQHLASLVAKISRNLSSI